jgi:pyridoxal phosphate enzyme (YggS family)
MARRVAAVRARLREAADRAGRDASAIRLVAVTKLFPASVIREAYALGLREFGENYVQEFEGKAPELADLSEARFHLIGHLQSNKSRRAAGLFHAIDAVDSPKLAHRLQDAAARPLDVKIEVKLSEEESKHGASPEQLPEVIAAIRECSRLRLTGLLTMPPWTDDPQASRPYFRRLRELAERYELPELSMGMSHDLEVAVEEGATEVRIGTALFGERVRA